MKHVGDQVAVGKALSGESKDSNCNRPQQCEDARLDSDNGIDPQQYSRGQSGLVYDAIPGTPFPWPQSDLRLFRGVSSGYAMSMVFRTQALGRCRD